MAASSSSSTTATISCCCHRLGPPALPKVIATNARRPPAPAVAGVSVSSYALRGACVAAAACVVMGMAGGRGGGGSGADMALAMAWDGAAAWRTDAAAVAVGAKERAPPRWSDRRQCPPWRANSLENIVPENLPRPSAPRRFNGVSVSAAAEGEAAPDLAAPPASSSSLALRPGTGCFSL